MVDKQSNSNRDAPANKIHTLKYDLFDMETLGCRHSSLYFWLKNKNYNVTVFFTANFSGINKLFEIRLLIYWNIATYGLLNKFVQAYY